MHKNLIALLLILAAVLACLAELYGWLLPTLSWPFSVSRDFPLLSLPGSYCPQLAVEGRFHWFGWFCMLLLALVGIVLLLRRGDSLRLSPEVRLRWQRFRSIRRGYWSLVLLLLMLLCASLDQCLVGKRALAVELQDGSWVFPAFSRDVLPGSTFGLRGNDAIAEADYRRLKENAGRPGFPKRVVMPPIPYDPTMDAAPFPTERLPMRDGVLYAADGVTPFNGQACRLYPDGQMHLRIRFRKGVPDGQVQGWTRSRKEVFSATYSQGKLIGHEYTGGRVKLQEFLARSTPGELYLVHYHPAPPLVGGHLLGTNSRGADIAAYLIGGLQVNIKAACIYLPVIYFIGLSLGMLMGYFGGRFDLFTQRCIEILSQLPFLFVVMILSDAMPLELRGMFLILSLMAMFGWMQMTYMVRTATMREKTRDYVAAARVMGAGPLHILFRHILPNIFGIVVTLIPFSVAAVVLSLASLDYLGFGLPDTYPSWGRLLNDGLAKLSCPWVVSAAFFALVVILLLVTFIGEAAREAADPRRCSYYD